MEETLRKKFNEHDDAFIHTFRSYLTVHFRLLRWYYLYKTLLFCCVGKKYGSAFHIGDDINYH